MPARLAPWPRARQTTLARCLWLAALLHGLALLWLGSAPEGTAPPGEGTQGRLNVTLRGTSDEGLPSPPQRVLPQAGTAPAEAPPRVGGRVRDTELPPEAAPGAARLGPAPQALPPPVPAPLPALEPLSATAPPVVRAPAPPLSSAALAPEPPPAPPPDPVLRTLAPEPPGARALPQPALAAPAAVPELAAAPRLPALAPLPSTALAPAEGRLEAGVLRAVVPPRAAPLPPPVAAPLPRLPPALLPQLGEAAPAPAPGPQAAATPGASPPPAPATPAHPPPAALATRGPAAVGDAAPTAPADAGPRLGADVAVPATAASAPRPLNLELGRLRGGELSRLAAPGVLPALPRPPETDKLAAEIEKTAREDCRRAYAGAGLLAVVPLAADTLRGKGCKW